MKLLSIGNSFSQDAHSMLAPIFEAGGEPLEAVDLVIGGCSLERHWYGFTVGAENYSYEVLDQPQGKCSLSEALACGDWDIVTLQQASHFSGMPKTYQPYLSDLASVIRWKCPGAALYMQQTWAYEIDSNHPGFTEYNRSQKNMYRRLTKAYRKAAASIDANIIPVGDVIQQLRQTCPYFDRENGGIPLTRDGFHLSLVEGRFAAGLTWYGRLTGRDVRENTYIPELAIPEQIRAIRETVYDVLNKR